MRTFIAVEIPENVKEEIIKIQKQLPEFKGKLPEKENLHLTLKFLGEISENKIEEIKKKLKEIQFKSFEVQIDRIGIFENNRRGIVWLNVANCENLQKEIDEKLSDFFEKEKRFMGHLTIARIKNFKDKNKFISEIQKIKIPKLKFSVDSFYIKKSILKKEKPIYEPLEKFESEK